MTIGDFDIKSQAVSSVRVQLPQVAMLRIGPNLTLAVEQDVTPKFDLALPIILLPLMVGTRHG